VLKYLPCTPTGNPQIWVPAGTPIAVMYNGVCLKQSSTDPAHLCWSPSGTNIQLNNFTPASLDLVAALVIVSNYP
jgi:hypothetical protein